MEWEIFGLVFTGLAALLVGMIVFFIIEAVFLWIGAKLARIEKASFGRAFTAAIALTIATFVLNIVFIWASVATAGTIGAILSILVAVWVIKSVFDTGWAQAAVAWFLSIVGAVVAVVLIGALVIGAAFL